MFCAFLRPLGNEVFLSFIYPLDGGISKEDALNMDILIVISPGLEPGTLSLED